MRFIGCFPQYYGDIMGLGEEAQKNEVPFSIHCIKDLKKNHC